jgi:DNA-directed RNA polymerase specialized sigma24 family protein
MLDNLVSSEELYKPITNPVNRAMFILHYHWGLTYEEVAYAFGVPEELVKSLILLAKKEVLDTYE